MQQDATDERWMRQALVLAGKGEGFTLPNPPVGAVIVSKGRLVGSGYHRKAGGPHAEVVALKDAGPAAHGACLYVTLEPCSTTGRTGPCTAAILKSGVRRVVVATRDPNPRHKGKGIRILRKAGLQVVENIGHRRAEELLRPFSKWITSQRPFLTLKLGTSLDGRIADPTGTSKWITSPASRKSVMRLRRRVDAILVGSGTAVKDDPSLLCNRPIPPFRVIVDSTGTLPLKAKLLNDPYVGRTLLVTTARCSDARRRAFIRKGADVHVTRSGPDGRVSMKALLAELGRRGLLHVLCEGGGELAESLIRDHLVDQYLFFVAPLLMGGHSVPAVGGKGWRLSACPRLTIQKIERSGPDLVIYAVRKEE